MQTQQSGPMAPPPIAPIGVRPHNYQNGISMPPPPSSATMQQQQKVAGTGQQRHSPQFGAGTIGQFNHGVPPPPPLQQFHMANQPPPAVTQPPQQQQAQSANSGGNFQTWGGTWGDHQLNNISELFGQGRSFGPLGSDFGSSGGSAVGGMRSASVIHPPAAGVIGGGPSSGNPSGANNPSSQPIGAGRTLQNASPSAQQSQQNQQRNGWSSFATETWNAQLSGIYNDFNIFR